MGRHFRAGDRADQGYLLPPDVREWLPEGHLAWGLTDLTDELDLSGFEGRYRADGQGRAAYDPVMMVRLLMYCYCKGIRSSRGIEMATFDDLGARVICGNLHPDHATAARFAVRHEGELKGLLAVSVAACARRGLVSVDLVAGDGTKVKASASMASNRTGADLDAEIAALEDVIAAETALWVEQHLAADDPAPDDDDDDPDDDDPAPEAAAAADGDDAPAGAAAEAAAGAGAGAGRRRTAQTLARRRQAREKLAADTAAAAGREQDKEQARAARLAERAAAKEKEAARLHAEAAARSARYAERAAACPPGRRPPGKAPAAPGENRDVRRVTAAAARLRDQETAARAAAGTPAPGRELKINLTDPASRVMPGKKGGFAQMYNVQVIACKKQVILAIGTHDSPADTGALHPMMAKVTAVLAAAGITGPVLKALWDAGYASDANFTATCGTELYVAVTRESRQAGRSTAGRDPATMKESWQQMTDRLDTPEGKALYKQRSGIIEPVFAQLFARLGRHLNYRGTRTDLELHLWAASHNLLKAIRARRPAPA